MNGLLDASGSDEARCTVQKLWQPPFFDVAHALDAWRFDGNQPNHVDQLDPTMPPDFRQDPDAALGRLEMQVNDPAVPRPPGWPNAAPPLRRRRRGSSPAGPPHTPARRPAQAVVGAHATETAGTLVAGYAHHVSHGG